MKAIVRVCACISVLFLLLCAAALAESFTAIVSSERATVYSDRSCTLALGTMGRYGVVSVEAWSDSVALVKKGSRMGYMRASDLTRATEAGRAAQVTERAKVYKKPNTKSASVTVKAGFKLDLIAVKGSWAMVERGGIVGYMRSKYVRTVEASQTDAAVAQVYAAYVAWDRVTVYQTASSASVSLGTLKRGATVTVRAVSGQWANVEKNGRTGWCMLSALARADEATPATTPAPAADDYLNDTSLSAERRIYLYLTREMGLNTAAACGILANIERECDFNVNDQSYDGGYGIVQWTGERNTALKSWCAQHGYSHTRLAGQLRFLKYELETTQKKTLSYLKAVSDTATGAYNAAYYFCYYFEIPANRTANSVRRGELARDTYWPRYAG